MTIRVYDDKIRFTTGGTDIDLEIDSDGLRFTKPIRIASSVSFTLPSQGTPPAMGGLGNNIFYSGGFALNPPFYNDKSIDRFPGANLSGTATDVGDIISPSNGRIYSQTQHSSISSGFTTSNFSPSTFASTNGIFKFPFAISSGTGSEVASVANTHASGAGHSTYDTGYASGGSGAPGYSTSEKFPFAISSGTASSVGSLSTARSQGSQQTQSRVKGYMAQGKDPTNSGYEITTIEVITFANDNISTFPTNLVDNSPSTSPYAPSSSRVYTLVGGFSSKEDAYYGGGRPSSTAPPSYVFAYNTIRRTPFSSDNVIETGSGGNLSPAKHSWTGASTPTVGAIMGGYYPTSFGTPHSLIDNVDKFNFSSFNSSSDVASLTLAKALGAGHQD